MRIPLFRGKKTFDKGLALRQSPLTQLLRPWETPVEPETHQLRRRLPSGLTVPADTPRLTWFDLVEEGPKARGVTSRRTDHPSHPYRRTDLAPTMVKTEVAGPVPGQASRQVRRGNR